MYVSPIDDVVRAHQMHYHQYADDLMLYTALTPSMFCDLSSMTECTDAVSAWFMENALLLNPGKTEAVIFGTRQRLAGVASLGGLNVAGSTVQFSDALKLLGVTLDATLSFDKHVSNVVRACNFHIRALRHIRPLLTLEAAKTVAVSIVGSRLDYCNSLLYGTTERNFDRLQRVQNILARAVLQASWSASAHGLLQELHWLPVRQRVRFKVAAVTFKAKYCGLPAYLGDDLRDYQPARTLRSSTAPQLQRPQSVTAFASRAFTIAAPIVWNSLSANTRSADSLTCFKRRLKSELFATAYAT